MPRLLSEIVCVGGGGAILAIALNWLSPSGLALSRDYFPRLSVPRSQPEPVATNAVPTNSTPVQTTRADSGPDPDQTVDPAIQQQIQAHGLTLVSHAEAVELHRDPRFTQGMVLFLDARDSAHYQEGHIPGAYQFDHYRLDDYVAEVIPAAQVAEQIVVYCSGGDCEDSLFAAVQLIQLGIDQGKILIYAGGMTEWRKEGLPEEEGVRRSGRIKRNHG